MADQASLRFIGLTFGAITAAVTLVAVMLVVNVDRSVFEHPTTAFAATNPR